MASGGGLSIRPLHVVHLGLVERGVVDGERSLVAHLHRGAAERSAFGYGQHELCHHLRVNGRGSDVSSAEVCCAVFHYGRERGAGSCAVLEGNLEVEEGSIL